MARRRFNRAERTYLWLATGGRCASCGIELEPGWHADHVRPFSAGGPTDVANGAALCPACNLRKGSGMKPTPLRKQQQQLVDVCVDRIGTQGAVVAAELVPGYGKELAGLAAFDQLVAATGEDLVMLHLAPRVALSQQIESKFHGEDGRLGYRQRFDLKHVSDVRIVAETKPPILVPDANAYTASFSLLSKVISSPAAQGLWEDFARRTRGRLVLVVDEAHLVGFDEVGEGGTDIARVLDGTLRGSAAQVIVLTGTPARDDGLPIWACDHLYVSSRDEHGRAVRVFHADVVGRYREAVEAGYLIPFTGLEVQGTHRRTDLETGEIRELETGGMDSGLGAVLNDRRVREDMLSEFVRAMRNARRTMHPLVGGIVWADRVSDLSGIERELRRMAPQFSTEIVASTDPKAAARLGATRHPGSADVLLTVRMASIGYDAPHRMIGVDLSAERTIASQEQRGGRLARVWDEIPLDVQRMYYVGLDDQATKAWFDRWREDSDLAVAEREKRGPGAGGGPARDFLSETEIDGYRIDGLHATGDATDQLTLIARQIHDRRPAYSPDVILDILAEARQSEAPEPGAVSEPYSVFKDRMSRAQEDLITRQLMPALGYPYVPVSVDRARNQDWVARKKRITGRLNGAVAIDGGVEGTRDYWLVRERIIAAVIEGRRDL